MPLYVYGDSYNRIAILKAKDGREARKKGFLRFRGGEDILHEVYELNEDAVVNWSTRELIKKAEEDFDKFIADFGKPLFY